MRLLAIAVAATLVIGACGGGAPPAPAAGSPAPASPTGTPTLAPAKLSVVYGNITPANLAPLIAVEAGIFKKNGLDVDLQLIEGGAKSMAALLSGQIQIAHLGGTEVMSAYVGGADVVSVSVNSPYSSWVFMVPSGYKSPADLKGKPIGIVTKGGSSETAVLKALERLGLDHKDVTIVAIGSVPNLATAMISGAVYAGPAHPPETVLLESKGFRTIVDLAKEHVPVADNTTTTTRKFLDANRTVVQRYVDSIIEAIARAKKDKPFAMDVLKKYKIVPDDPAQLSATYDFYVGTIFVDYPHPRAEFFLASKAELVKTNPRVADLDVTKVIDESFVRSAEDRKVGR